MTKTTATRRRLQLTATLVASLVTTSTFADDRGELTGSNWQSATEIATSIPDRGEATELEFKLDNLVRNEELLQQRFADGSLHIERGVAEDSAGNLVNHGTYKEYDEKGGLVRTGTFDAGRKEGTWSQLVSAATVRSLVETIDNGFQAPFTSEASFVDDKLQGHWSIADAKGRPVVLWQFSNGVRENVSTWFDSRGTALLEINYAAGIPHGPAKITTRGKKDAESVVFEQGRVLRTRTEWYDGSNKTKKKAEETVLVPAGHTVVNHSWWNSTLEVLPLNTEEIVRHGLVTTWYSNGQKSMEGRYRFGETDGDFKWWYSNGQPQGIGSYASGAMNGRWVWWHTNGMKQMEGIYSGDAKEGLWSCWDPNGKIVFRGSAAELEEAESSIAVERQQADPIGQLEASENSRSASLIAPRLNRVR